MSRKIKRTPLSALSMKAAFEEFVIAQTAKGLAAPTIKNYHSHFHSISRHIDTSFSELVQADIEGMIAQQIQREKGGIRPSFAVQIFYNLENVFCLFRREFFQLKH